MDMFCDIYSCSVCLGTVIQSLNEIKIVIEMLPHLKMLTVWEHFLEEFHEMGPRETAIGTLKAEPNGNSFESNIY